MRVLRLVSVGLVWLGAVGCAGRSSDDDDGSQRTEDACEDLCETFANCGNLFEVGECVDACVRDADSASRSCLASFDDLVDCVNQVDRECDGAVERCQDPAENFEDDCDDDFTDTLDVVAGGNGGRCGNDSCPFALDGYCDEPDFCPTGTDLSDCGC